MSLGFHQAVRTQILLLGCLCLTQGLEAHPPLGDQVAALTRLIAASPARRDVYLIRADCYRRQGVWVHALEDISRAQSLGSPADSIAVGRAKVFLDQGRPELAATELQAVSACASPEVHTLRAEAMGRTGKTREAVAALDQAIELNPDLGPEIYLERARLLLVLDPPQRQDALTGLNRALTRMGPVPGLSFMAAEIASDLGNHDHALELLDRLAPYCQRQEDMLARRGDILVKAGRTLEAQAAYTEALARIDSAPPSPTSTRLGERLRDALRVTR